MKQSTLEWIEKAEADWKMAQLAYRARKDRLYDAACFYCQQCVEKYLKAKLNEAGVALAKRHDLPGLFDLLLPVEPSWTALQTQMDYLNPYAVRYHYPGYKATKAEAKEAIKHCREVRRVIRTAFGLPV